MSDRQGSEEAAFGGQAVFFVQEEIKSFRKIFTGLTWGVHNGGLYYKYMVAEGMAALYFSKTMTRKFRPPGSRSCRWAF
jgi:hypothetical protein